MATMIHTLRGSRAAQAARPLGARLGAALDRFLSHHGDHELICGDAD